MIVRKYFYIYFIYLSFPGTRIRIPLEDNPMKILTIVLIAMRLILTFPANFPVSSKMAGK